MTAWRRGCVARYFRRWKLDGTWLRIHRYLRDWVRLELSRRASPSVAIIDSQSVKIGVLSNNSVGYDGGKNIKGRKRHILVDTTGLILMVVVTAANISFPRWCQNTFCSIKGWQALVRTVVPCLHRWNEKNSWSNTIRCFNLDTRYCETIQLKFHVSQKRIIKLFASTIRQHHSHANIQLGKAHFML